MLQYKCHWMPPASNLEHRSAFIYSHNRESYFPNTPAGIWLQHFMFIRSHIDPWCLAALFFRHVLEPNHRVNSRQGNKAQSTTPSKYREYITHICSQLVAVPAVKCSRTMMRSGERRAICVSVSATPNLVK